MILFDIDHFKQINDVYGHNVGDGVLRFFAQLIKNNIRSSDIVARWGGEEFVLLVPIANQDLAISLADKTRELIESTLFPTVGKVTASLGVTLFKADDDTDALIKRADEALYKAKREGRNRVEFVS